MSNDPTFTREELEGMATGYAYVFSHRMLAKQCLRLLDEREKDVEALRHYAKWGGYLVNLAAQGTPRPDSGAVARARLAAWEADNA